MTTDPITPAVLYGLQCANHPEVGTLPCETEEQARHLAYGVPCYRLVTSTDGGRTWARADT